MEIWKSNEHMIIAVAVFMVLDFATGLLQAVKNGNFRSCVMREGIWHKLGEVLVIVLGLACEFFLPWMGMEVTVPIVKALCIYLYIMELGSIVENMGAMFPALQDILSKVLGAYTHKDEETRTTDETKQE